MTNEKKINYNSFFESVAHHNLERFHSETIAWIFNTFPDTAKNFIKSIHTDISSIREIELNNQYCWAESNQIDILLKYSYDSKNYQIIIENKIKASEHKIEAEKLKKGNVNVWLLNTGWVGGSYGVGSRIKLSYTRSLITAALNGELNNVEYGTTPYFKLNFPKSCPNVPSEILEPKNAWKDKEDFNKTAQNLAASFVKNFEQYASAANAEILAAAPQVEVTA